MRQHYSRKYVRRVIIIIIIIIIIVIVMESDLFISFVYMLYCELLLNL